MRLSSIWLPAACALVAVSHAATSADPAVLEQRIGELKRELDRNTGEKHRDHALDLLRRMAELDPEHPKVYSSVVRLHLARREYDLAAEMIESFSSPGGPGRAYGRGLLQFHRKQYDEALARMGEALDRYRALNHLAGQASCHILRGIVMQRSGREEAAAEYRTALDLLETLEDRLGTSSVLSNLGKLELAGGRPEEALALHRRALSIREEERDLRGQGLSWQEIGRTLQAAGDPEGAIEATARALAVRRQREDELEQISSLRQLARYRSQAGEFDRAAELLRETLGLARAIGNRGKEVQTLVELGDVLLSAGRSREAIGALEPAVEALGGSRSRKLELKALGKLGVALLRVGEFSRAGDVLRRALDRSAKQPALEAAVRNDLAKVALATGELPGALLHQQRALELYRRLKDRRGELRGENNMGVIYYSLGDLATSKRHFEQALALARELENQREQARSLSNLGVVLADEGSVVKALDAFSESIGLQQAEGNRRGAAFGRFNAAGVLKPSRPGEALALAERALADFREAGDREGEAFTLNLLGSLHDATGRRDDALQTYALSLGLSREHGYRRQEWMAHAGRALALERAGRPGEALADYTRAIELVEGVRSGLETGEFKMRYLATKVNLHERAMMVAIGLHGGANSPAAAAAAFRLAERVRARSLLDLFAESRASFGSDLAPELGRRERALLDEISATALRLVEAPDEESRKRAREELDRAEERLERLKVEIRRSDPHYASVVYPEPSSLADVRREALAPGETLLQYFIGEDHSLLWVVDRDGARMQVLPHPSEIDSLVAGFLKRAGHAGVALGSGPAGAAESEALARVLLPAELPKGHRVLVAPDGPLHHLPFEALRRDGRYLIEDHEVAVIPSATVLRMMRELPRPAVDGGFLGVGDPVAGEGDAAFPPLPHSRAALQRIAELFPEEGRVLLTGESSTITRLREQKLERFRYLHFATHGWLDENPRHSGLRLSPAAGGEAGGSFLYVDEILSMRLASELVVLSACRSGLGEQVTGEGLLGMTRAFLHAGARAVVVSLWNVDDRSTAEFMQAFYEELTGGRAATDALRRAKLGFVTSDRAVRRQPYRWAPFVLVGDPGRAPKTERAGRGPD